MNVQYWQIKTKAEKANGNLAWQNSQGHTKWRGSYMVRQSSEANCTADATATKEGLGQWQIKAGCVDSVNKLCLLYTNKQYASYTYLVPSG